MAAMTSTPADPPRGFAAATGLRWLTGSAVFGLGISGLYAATGIGLPCPFREITGWQCPFCGGTRLGSALLHGDVAAALAYNPLVFLALLIGVILGGLWVVELLGGPSVRPPKRWLAAARRVPSVVWWVCAGLATAAYVVLRNLV